MLSKFLRRPRDSPGSPESQLSVPHPTDAAWDAWTSVLCADEPWVVTYPVAPLYGQSSLQAFAVHSVSSNRLETCKLLRCQPEAL